MKQLWILPIINDMDTFNVNLIWLLIKIQTYKYKTYIESLKHNLSLLQIYGNSENIQDTHT